MEYVLSRGLGQKYVKVGTDQENAFPFKRPRWEILSCQSGIYTKRTYRKPSEQLFMATELTILYYIYENVQKVLGLQIRLTICFMV